MKTFCIETLGCKVNHYESEQVASLLRARGLIETSRDQAELRIINSCSVTVQAASQSRQVTRRMIRLPVLSDIRTVSSHLDLQVRQRTHADSAQSQAVSSGSHVVVMGCWATSDSAAAAEIPGVDAVLTHRHNIADELDRLLELWKPSQSQTHATVEPTHTCADEPPRPAMEVINGWIKQAGSGAGDRTSDNRTKSLQIVNEISARQRSDSQHDLDDSNVAWPSRPWERFSSASAATTGEAPVPRAAAITFRGTNSLPLLGERQTGRQRAFLKVQDGCDAHCTYCIIPKLRPSLYSKPIDEVVGEAQRMVASGHVEIVLTGIFLGAYGQPTALRRRQPNGLAPLAQLIESLCTKVTGLKRLRLSSLEPGDLDDDLLSVLSSHEQVVPHFHLPLQSGSDPILRRMNRQYGRDDFLRMIEKVNAKFDRPAITTDIIVGFPTESNNEFEQTVEVCERSRFIHIHAFPYSPRPGTAAARWNKQFIHGPIFNERIDRLRSLADQYSFEFRSQSVGQIVRVIVERDQEQTENERLRQGRCERYFPVHFQCNGVSAGDLVPVRIEQVTMSRTLGVLVR
jgi:MiaB/RimO family radical SAM methylthiotransferase